MYSANDLSRGRSDSLTYEPFFGLREKPFSLSADPRFLFRSPAHGSAFDALHSGIRRREGLIVLTGEIGTGKTTLCRSVLQHLDRRTFAAFVTDPFVSREDLLKALLVDFGVVAIADLTRGRFSGASRSDLSYLLYEFLDSLAPLQAFAVVVIDEAQNLSLPLLEEIRILSELERREKLLQVVLVGQPELRSSLRLPQMRQAEQRVSVRCELPPLDAAGVAGYVRHRLQVAGDAPGRVEFSRAALELLSQASGGVPRVINRLCDRTLDHACAARTFAVEVEFVRQAVADLGDGLGVHEPQDAPARETIAQARTAQPEPLRASPDSDPQGLGAFLTEEEAAAAAQRAHALTTAARVRHGRRRAAATLAATLVVTAVVGIPAWYLQPYADGPGEYAALQLPPPPAPAARPGMMPLALPLPESADQLAAPPEAADAAGGGYTITVASFSSRTRAERLVAELGEAGYRAHAVERDWGPPRGRLFHVSVGTYDSALDVQRHLQQIRDLPGGYRDARIVER